MRKIVVLMFALFFSAMSTAGNDNLFNCVDPADLTMDDKCIAKKIENSVQFQSFETKFQNSVSDLGGNAMATMIFHQDKMWIQVVAVDEQEDSTIAAVQHQKKID